MGAKHRKEKEWSYERERKGRERGCCGDGRCRRHWASLRLGEDGAAIADVVLANETEEMVRKVGRRAVSNR